MRLLYTLTAYPPYIGGAQLHQHILAQQLQARHTIQVVSHWDRNRTDWLLGTTLRAPSNSKDYVINDIPVHRLGLSPWEKTRLAPYVPLYYPLMAVALPPIANLLEKHITSYAAKADVVHNIRIGREGLSYASYQAARRHDRPFVLTPVHHPRWVGWRYRAYLRLYQMADAVIALTQAEKRILMGLSVPEERIAVTGIGAVLAPTADPNAFLKQYGLEEPIVLFLGQHYLYKGYQQVLQAASLVWQKVPETQFVFIGPPVADSENAFAETNDSRIHRLGNVDLQTKTNALAACTLLCVPSSQESFGGIYTEAWSFGKPVIGCAIPAVAEVINDRVDGLLTAQEPAQIAECILHLLANPTQAIEMGMAGKHKVESRFTWENIAEQVERVYRTSLVDSNWNQKAMSTLLSHFILKTRIDATSYNDVCDRIQFWAAAKTSCYIVAANVHVVMTGYWQRSFQKVINGAALVTPDGMPLVVGLRLLGAKRQQRVYGPDLMLAWCDRAAQTGTPIYLYGGTESMLARLQENLERRFSGLAIAGYHAPPFRPLTLEEEEEDRDRIQASGAPVVFVGLGCPKQEEWMARQQGELSAVMIGVGAAFSFHSGEVSQAPRWMMAWGLEWLYRFAVEPQRLWQRYLVNNPAFLILFGWQLVSAWFHRRDRRL